LACTDSAEESCQEAQEAPQAVGAERRVPVQEVLGFAYATEFLCALPFDDSGKIPLLCFQPLNRNCKLVIVNGWP
jgi:hypothetical protein